MEDKVKVEEALDEMANRDLGKIKVLMIEDDAFLTDLVLDKLMIEGCIPYRSETADEGISLARQFGPDVIILDLMLPGKSGEDAIKELKSDVELKNIPVIVFSNKSEQESINNLLQLGASKYLIKSSTDIKELSQIVKDLVKQ